MSSCAAGSDSRPLIDRLHRILADLAGRATPKNPLGKAVAYAINQWPTLTVFLEDPRPTPTSSVSSAGRPSAAAISCSQAPTTALAGSRSCTLSSSSCDLVGAPPFEYLRDVFGRLADDWPKARLRELLPAAWLADQRRQQPPSDRAAEAIADVGSAVPDAISAAA